MLAILLFVCHVSALAHVFQCSYCDGLYVLLHSHVGLVDVDAHCDVSFVCLDVMCILCCIVLPGAGGRAKRSSFFGAFEGAWAVLAFTEDPQG